MRSHNNLLVTSLVLACLLHTVVPAKPILELVEGREGAMYNYTYHLPTDLNTQGCNGKVPVIFWLGGIGTFRRGAELVVDKVCVRQAYLLN